MISYEYRCCTHILRYHKCIPTAAVIIHAGVGVPGPQDVPDLLPDSLLFIILVTYIPYVCKYKYIPGDSILYEALRILLYIPYLVCTGWYRSSIHI